MTHQQDLLLGEAAAVRVTTASRAAFGSPAPSTAKAAPAPEKAAVHDEEITTQTRILSSLMAGAVAGALAKTVIAPLDRTKINFQISNREYNTMKALQFLRQSYREKGALSLWRGNSATMARIIPYAAIQFSAHEQFKYLLDVDQRPGQETKPFVRFLSGSLAGVVSQSLTYPLDMARARMAVTHKDKYGSLSQVFVKIWREEGPRTLYRGYTPTVLGIIPYAGTSFATYGTLKKTYMDYKGLPDKNPNAFERLIFGAIAGLLGQSTSYPLDIVRRRMQTSVITGERYNTVIGTLIKIYRKEGLKNGLFKGLSMNWVKGPVAVGISFSTFDTAKRFFQSALS
ncbi:mitochondrial coenzyme A transporter SLC25A42 [Ischnura elegans]|uniref:mitochondrial coenzyme A transporter SLC25A42 n=1 Tax=Ischnura elegans TaxID=197161 RepID=UPI001ED8696F|nr:mitochondrial coenzyme A transporter SLC25A42 [Ischnura elegans]XP_046397559.1 mitochondrial coenzyme A transporter SLC25A42 [Ischnura elegans]